MTANADPQRLAGLLERLGRPTLEFGVNMARWQPSIKARFIELAPDAALVNYLERIAATRAKRGRTILQRLLRLAISDYDVNALLGMYPMHLLSTSQAEQLLLRPRGGRLLDVGAGSGDVTAALAPLFDSTEVIETSKVAAKRLRASGYQCHEYDVAEHGILGGAYDVIAMLNVLDRSDRPRTLLERCHQGMATEADLLLSVPLPYHPHVYVGAASREPRERLSLVGSNFSDALMRMIHGVVEPAGFEVLRFTRVPYLSGGDSDRALTVLDAAVLVCRKVRSAN